MRLKNKKANILYYNYTTDCSTKTDRNQQLRTKSWRALEFGTEYKDCTSLQLANWADVPKDVDSLAGSTSPSRTTNDNLLVL